MVKNIVAIGGAVIKTAWNEIRNLASNGAFDVLIHNGASLFHDFQRATEELPGHSYSLADLLEDYRKDEAASLLVWEFLRENARAPKDSLTRICEDQGINVLLAVALGTDFWHLFDQDWGLIARRCRNDFLGLIEDMGTPFKFFCLGSAVIHPELFAKALAVAKSEQFTTVVVDFREMYRPRSRVAVYGQYLLMEHKEFLNSWIESRKRERNEADKAETQAHRPTL